MRAAIKATTTKKCLKWYSKHKHKSGVITVHDPTRRGLGQEAFEISLVGSGEVGDYTPTCIATGEYLKQKVTAVVCVGLRFKILNGKLERAEESRKSGAALWVGGLTLAYLMFCSECLQGGGCSFVSRCSLLDLVITATPSTASASKREDSYLRG